MSVEQAATAETALAGSSGKRGETRILGPLAVGLALLSAFVTFVVLADLTPISPTHYVVVTLLTTNAATMLLLIGIITGTYSSVYIASPLLILWERLRAKKAPAKTK